MSLDIEGMKGELERLLELIEDEDLRRRVERLLLEAEVSLEGEPLPLEEAPAGARVHHAYRGGLLQHTIAVARLTLTLCDLIEEVYGGEVDRDLALAGALLHDVMKRHVYVPKPERGYLSSPLGERMDHLILLVSEMYRRGFPLELIHIAASHHGDRGPIGPKTIEALIVYIADLADSEMSKKILRAAEYLIKTATGRETKIASSREALEVIRAKAREGWEGVRRLRET
jgi:7,8-dihydroneopterin 2',3'-cyclic phosphate phosphodiesterase